MPKETAVDYLPLFFDLKNKPCLLIGGGTIATRKARLLAKAGAVIHVVAHRVQDELSQLVQDSNGTESLRDYQASDLDQKYFVVCATDNAELNQRVAAECHARYLPVNVVDNPALCSVITPAIIDRSPLVIGIASGGESPVLARKVRTQLEQLFPGSYGELAKFASRFRTEVKQQLPDEDQRRRFWESVLDGAVSEQVLAGNIADAERLFHDQLSAVAVNKEEGMQGEVYLVGAGPGDPDLLTFKALRLMQKAEVVLYDRLVSQPILDMVRRDAERIYVGKRCAEHAMPQQSINEQLLFYALQGKRVLRLKGGDPFIFGRGGEEIELLAEHNVPFQVVPGITAASACACYAGIPLTHRDHAQSVRFLTGHMKAGTLLEYPWQELVSNQQTLVFYMGLAGLRTICDSLIAHGKPADTPMALIENGTLPNQQVHLATLQTMPDYVETHTFSGPTLLIVGTVVNLHHRLAWQHR